MNRRLGLALFGWLSGVLLRLLGATWRVEIRGTDPRRLAFDPSAAPSPAARPRPVLAALLHESLVVSAWLFRDAGYCVAVSQSRDGSLVEATLRALGFAQSARGSSSRGGSAAFLGLLRQLELGTTVAVLVDGPRGPAGVAKPGIAALARHSATPIQPLALAARPALRLSSWDRSLVPLPFARVVCVFGEPIAAGDPGRVRRRVRGLGLQPPRATEGAVAGAGGGGGGGARPGGGGGQGPGVLAPRMSPGRAVRASWAQLGISGGSPLLAVALRQDRCWGDQALGEATAPLP
ncbi:MAG: DUF374 domain-containing protein [Deltaproteobacteria bacterium]|nr:DUF374 domain-containing protein [Deltaproteobacteria bacterium]